MAKPSVRFRLDGSYGDRINSNPYGYAVRMYCDVCDTPAVEVDGGYKSKDVTYVSLWCANCALPLTVAIDTTTGNVCIRSGGRGQ